MSCVKIFDIYFNIHGIEWLMIFYFLYLIFTLKSKDNHEFDMNEQMEQPTDWQELHCIERASFIVWRATGFFDGHIFWGL